MPHGTANVVWVTLTLPSTQSRASAKAAHRHDRNLTDVLVGNASTALGRDTPPSLVPTTTGYLIWGVFFSLSSGRPDFLILAPNLGRAHPSKVPLPTEVVHSVG
jgi:hypothetical protein